MVRGIEVSKANEKQIDGSHYKDTPKEMPEHWDVVRLMEWDYFIGNATRYLWRLGKKHKGKAGYLVDLEKAIHYLEKKREIVSAELREEQAADYHEATGGPTSGYVNQDR